MVLRFFAAGRNVLQADLKGNVVLHETYAALERDYQALEERYLRATRVTHHEIVKK